MKLYFGQCEVTMQMAMLRDCGVSQFAVDAVKWDGTGLPEGDVLVYCSDEDAEASYVENVAALGQAGGLWVVPAWAEPVEGVECAAVWDGNVMDEAIDLAEHFGAVVVSPAALTDLSRLPLLRRAIPGRLGTVSSSLRALKAISWDFAVVHHWVNPMAKGETQVWDGKAMHRYSPQRQKAVRETHRSAIERLGVDADKVIANDLKEAAKLAILSWRGWEEASIAANGTLEATDAPEVPGGQAPAIAGRGPRHERKRIVIPTLTVHLASADGDDEAEDEVHVRSTSRVHRVCDSCFVAAQCPQFEYGANCAFEIPVEIKTKDQLVAVLQSALEIQSQRVMEARLFEELAGEGLDPKTSAELDRLLSMSAKFKEITTDEQIFQMSVKAKGGGVLSSLFGSQVGRANRSLPGAVDPDDILGPVLGVER